MVTYERTRGNTEPELLLPISESWKTTGQVGGWPNFQFIWNEPTAYSVSGRNNFLSAGSWTMLDNITPNFHALKKSSPHLLPVQYLDTVKHEVTVETSLFPFTWDRGMTTSQYYREKLRSELFLGQIPYHIYDTDSYDPVSDLERYTVTATHAKISKSVAATLVAIAEFKKTATLLIDGMTAFYEVVIDLARLKNPKNWRWNGRKGISKTFLRLFDSVGNVWMWARYGIRPTLYDITDHQKALKAAIARIRPPTAASVFRSYESTIEGDEVGSVVFGYTGHYLVTKTRTTTKIKVTSGMKIKLDLTPFTTAHTVFGLHRVTNLVWELLPLSFVVDWFANIGQLIDAHEINPYTVKYGGYTTIKTETISEVIVVSCRGKTDHYNGLYDHSLSTGNIPAGTVLGRRISTRFERKPIAPLTWIPNFNVDLDTFKLVDLAVITKNLVKGLVNK